MPRRTEYITPESIDHHAIASIATMCCRWHGHVIVPTNRPLTDSELRELNEMLRDSNVIAARDQRSPSGLNVLFVERQASFKQADR